MSSLLGVDSKILSPNISQPELFRLVTFLVVLIT